MLLQNREKAKGAIETTGGCVCNDAVRCCGQGETFWCLRVGVGYRNGQCSGCVLNCVVGVVGVAGDCAGDGTGKESTETGGQFVCYSIECCHLYGIVADGGGGVDGNCLEMGVG